MSMPQTRVVFYREEDGAVPILDWLDTLPEKAQDKCRLKLERLQERGHELRRPEADFLRDGVYELRVRHGRVNYRMLYFFYENIAAVISHGVVKEQRVPPKEIDRAVTAKERFVRAPKRHTYAEK
jgi:phage-related protein